MLITVIIATKNRPEQLRECLGAIKNSTYKNFEIIIANQGNPVLTRGIIKSLNLPHVTHIVCKEGGKSNALNAAVREARGEIMAFTDDDCIASPDWLATMSVQFKKGSQISALFGKTLPYKKHLHKGQFCPCTFTKRFQSVIAKPRIHYRSIGFGNNMAISLSTLQKIGPFKTWLGPGSAGSNAEDAEIALRLLTKGYKILYNPNTVMYHNKWLTRRQMKQQRLSYMCGEMACYGYFYFQQHFFARKIMHDNVTDVYNALKKLVKRILLIQWDYTLIKNMYDTTREITWKLRGLLVGFGASFVDPIR